MITFTKDFTIIEGDNVRTFQHTYRKMDDKMFEHYMQNPIGMISAVREHFKIPDDKTFSVVTWSCFNPDAVGCVFIHNNSKKAH